MSSSSIQEAFFRNHDLLKEQGFHYFAEKIDESVHAHSQQCVKLNSLSSEFPTFQEMQRFRRLISDIGSEKVFYSIGALSGFITERSLNFLSEVVNNFSVNLIIYLRCHDHDLTLAFYIQGTPKKRFKLCAVCYGITTGAVPDLTRFGYLDNNTRIHCITNTFGKRKVNVRLFRKGALIKGDVVDDFCNYEGDKIECKFWVKEPVGFKKYNVGHLISLSNMPNCSLFKALLQIAIDNTGKIRLATNEAISFHSHFEKSNLQLAHLLGFPVEDYTFSNDFDAYPEKQNSYWSEKSANESIIRILNARADYTNNTSNEPKPSSRELYELRPADYAISLISNDNELAFNYLARAS